MHLAGVTRVDSLRHDQFSVHKVIEGAASRYVKMAKMETRFFFRLNSFQFTRSNWWRSSTTCAIDIPPSEVYCVLSPLPWDRHNLNLTLLPVHAPSWSSPPLLIQSLSHLTSETSLTLFFVHQRGGWIRLVTQTCNEWRQYMNIFLWYVCYFCSGGMLSMLLTLQGLGSGSRLKAKTFLSPSQLTRVRSLSWWLGLLGVHVRWVEFPSGREFEVL